MSMRKSTSKGKTLSQKFLILFTSMLGVLFIVLLVVVQAIAQVYSNEYINNDILSAHEDLEVELGDIFNEINYGYTRITQNDELEKLSQNTPYDEKKEVFKRIISSSSLSEDYLNVSASINDQYYSLNEGFDSPRLSLVESIKNGGNGLFIGDSSNNTLTVGRRFQSVAYGLEGYIVFYLSQERLDEIATRGNLGKGISRIIDSSYSVIASSNGEGNGSKIFEKDKYTLGQEEVYRKSVDGTPTLIAITKIDYQYEMGLYAVSEISVYSLQKDFLVLSIILACIAVIALIVSLVLSVYLAKNTTKPINKLSTELARVDFSADKPIFGIGTEGDEIYELEKSYNDMLERLFHLMRENEQNMETQRKLEIDALQMQINPHFLYNTLDAIAWMSKIKKQPEIEKLVMNLAKFFRLSLHKGDKYITISEEGELVEHFLEIEKIRFPNTIRYVNQIPEELGEYTTIKLILQPIVENSIKHGFAEKEGIGTITVSASRDGDDIYIVVSDDGKGFVVQEDFWTSTSKAPNGYGLRNVNERIRLEYGEGYGLTISSEPNKGTTVTAKIRKRL